MVKGLEHLVKPEVDGGNFIWRQIAVESGGTPGGRQHGSQESTCEIPDSNLGLQADLSRTRLGHKKKTKQNKAAFHPLLDSRTGYNIIFFGT